MREFNVEAQMSVIDRVELTRILGDIDDVKVIEILALNPSLDDVEEAAAWLTGNRDVLARDGRALTSAASAIVELLATDEEEPPPME
jgi:PHP family Zn ribbon phosphoesterase